MSIFTNIGFPAKSDFSASVSTSFKPSYVTGLTTTGADPKVVAKQCGSDLSCIWELAHYKNVSNVQDLKNLVDGLLQLRKTLQKSPPMFSGPITNTWNIDITSTSGSTGSAPGGGKAVYKIMTSVPKKPMAKVTYKIGGTVPAGLTVKIIKNVNGSWCQLTYDGTVLQALTGVLKLSFYIVATSPNGAVSILRPTIDICECLNGGKCGALSISFKQKGVLSFAPCTCAPAYSGTHCEKDKDECEAAFQPCFSGVACQDVKAPGTGYNCAACPPGFSGDGVNCFDVDECLGVNGSLLCQQECINTQTGYLCGCKNGYKLNGDMKTCSDVDECTSRLDNCGQVCQNTVGSFKCKCNAGYKLNPDNATCNATTQCPSTACNTTDLCAMVSGTAVCACRVGYVLATNQLTNAKYCKDVDECSSTTKPCQMTCINSVGSYTCSCPTGYMLAADKSTCEDIDECLTPPCFPGQQCLNTPGNYMCNCPTGYRLDATSKTCKPVDCGNPGQPAFSILRGSEFTYQKTVDYICQTGYYVSGRTSLRCEADGNWNGNRPSCLPVPCPALPAPVRGKVSSTRNSFGGIATFTCNPGYEVVGPATASCTERGTWSGTTPTCKVQNCPQIATPPNATVSKFDNQYLGYAVYSCALGYEAQFPNRSKIQCWAGGKWSAEPSPCVDTNECAMVEPQPGVEPKLPCAAKAECSNTLGSFVCTCLGGYIGNGKECENIDECTSGTHGCFGSECLDVNGGHICICPNDQYEIVSRTGTCEGITGANTGASSSGSDDGLGGREIALIVVVAVLAVAIVVIGGAYLLKSRAASPGRSNKPVQFSNDDEEVHADMFSQPPTGMQSMAGSNPAYELEGGGAGKPAAPGFTNPAFSMSDYDNPSAGDALYEEMGK